MYNISRKNLLAYHLKKMWKRFPRQYNFFPVTYCMPVDKTIFEKDFKRNKNVGQKQFYYDHLHSINLKENLYRQARSKFPRKRDLFNKKDGQSSFKRINDYSTIYPKSFANSRTKIRPQDLCFGRFSGSNGDLYLQEGFN